MRILRCVSSANTHHPWLAGGTPEVKLRAMLYRQGGEGYVDTVLLAWAKDLADHGVQEDEGWIAAVTLPAFPSVAAKATSHRAKASE